MKFMLESFQVGNFIFFKIFLENVVHFLFFYSMNFEVHAKFVKKKSTLFFEERDFFKNFSFKNRFGLHFFRKK
jgi:hypothetical protein